ncbi:MAG: tRNA 2-thiouridine(34) synthase MnmA [Candidatus Omnitrophota bacterium]
MKKRVVIAMSGGVDSSVAAYLLKKQGYDVIGVTMCFGLDVGSNNLKNKPSCCGLSGINDAKRIAGQLNIPHYVINFTKEFKKYIVDDFEKEYLKGRTPNPCIRCNEFIKFNALLDKIKQYDADFLATGHYARIGEIKNQNAKIKNYFLKKARDHKKDQTYFLYRLTQEQLKHILFPLGNLTKEEVRIIAREAKLSVADKPGSQEICFLSGTNYKDYFKNHFGKKIKAGLMVDVKGNVLGQHKGLPYYTIGQRQGLGIALGKPMYVIKIDIKNNTVVVGDDKDRYSYGLIAKNPIFIGAQNARRSANGLVTDYTKNSKLVLSAKIRYNQKEAKAKITSFYNNKIKVLFDKPQNSITPGQAVVFYKKDIVLGGAIIEKVV